MYKHKKQVLFFAILALLVCNVFAQNDIDKKVDTLLAKMTLEEKIGQMNQYNGFWEVTGPAPKEGNAKEKYDHLKRNGGCCAEC